MTLPHADLSRAVWRKSRYSGGNGGQCVEVARLVPTIVAVRDSMDPDGARLILAPAAWTAFVDRVKREHLLWVVYRHHRPKWYVQSLMVELS